MVEDFYIDQNESWFNELYNQLCGVWDGYLYTEMLESAKEMGLPTHILQRIANTIQFIGTPDRFSYPGTGKISPTTIRYIKNVFEMATLLGESPISRVVEVGGGYGGLCKTLSVVCDFDEYILVDLPEAVAVQQKYLKNFPELYSKCKFVSCDNVEEVKDVDLFISNYALSECDYDTQINYYDKLVSKAKFAYIIYNLVNFNDFYYNKFTGRMSETFEFTTSKDYENTVILAKAKDQ